MHMLWDLLNKTYSDDDELVKDATLNSASASRFTTRGVAKIDVSNPYAIWANTTDSGVVGVVDHIVAEKPQLSSRAPTRPPSAHCMNVESEFFSERVNETALGPNAESQEHAFEVELVIYRKNL